MSDEPITPVEPAKRKRSWVGRSIVVGILCFIVIGFFGAVVVIELPFHLVCGWVIHANNTLPPLLAEWRSALLPLAALVVAGFMLHRFIRWATQATERNRPWRSSHTLAAMALLLLGYGAAITLIGIAHQSTWLLSERWIGNGRSGPLVEEMQAFSQTQNLTHALEEFHARNGRYPGAMDELDVPMKSLLVKTGDGGGAGSFIYLKPKGQPGGPEEPIIVSPMVGSRQEFVVGFTSTEVRAMNWEKLAKLLQPAAPAPLPTTPPTADE